MAFEPERSHRHQHDLEHADGDAPLRDPKADGPDLGRAAGAIQREEDRSASASPEGGGLEPETADRIQSERSNGRPLDPSVKASAEQTLGFDLSMVRVHDGPSAAQLSRDVGAIAFTSGRDIFVGDKGSATDATLMTHELTHTVQQGMGETKPASVGAADTAHEQAAESASASGPTAAGGEVQRYVTKDVKGETCRVAEDGNAAVRGEEGYSQQLYATDALIKDSNKKLSQSGDKGSYIKLVKTGEDVKVGRKNLHLVRPVFNPEGDEANKDLATENAGKDQDDTMALWADCGRSSRVVMGSHDDAAPHAQYKKGGKKKDTGASFTPSSYSDQIYLDTMPDFLKVSSNKKYFKTGVHYNGTDKSDVIVPTDANQARTQYWELGEDGRRAFDQKVGINTGANPDVGGGYTMNTEYGMPGFKGGRKTWNFHWAGVIMKAGSDNITLENYADGNGYESVNMEWNYQMYGTKKKGQTFQEEHLGSNTHGNRASTFAVKPDGD